MLKITKKRANARKEIEGRKNQKTSIRTPMMVINPEEDTEKKTGLGGRRKEKVPQEGRKIK